MLLSHPWASAFSLSSWSNTSFRSFATYNSLSVTGRVPVVQLKTNLHIFRGKTLQGLVQTVQLIHFVQKCLRSIILRVIRLKIRNIPCSWLLHGTEHYKPSSGLRPRNPENESHRRECPGNYPDSQPPRGNGPDCCPPPLLAWSPYVSEGCWQSDRG